MVDHFIKWYQAITLENMDVQSVAKVDARWDALVEKYTD